MHGMWNMQQQSIKQHADRQDDFVLRAREKIETDEEITVSYLGEDTLWEDFDDGLTMLDLESACTLW